MKRTGTLPRPVTWIVRIVCWAVSLLLIWVLFRFYTNMKQVNHVAACMEIMGRNPGAAPHTSLDAAKDLVSCLEKRAGFPEKYLYASSRKAVQALPFIPCRYVGIWTATRQNSVYRITLRDDSQYRAEPLRDGSPNARVLGGSWGMHAGSMVWLHDEGTFWPPDVNRVTNINDTLFTLREADGSVTRYDLVERVQSRSCVPD